MKKIKDHYYKKAKKEGYQARSIYKLKEIQQKRKVIKRGDKIVELGAAPGSWSQYALKIVGKDGVVLGIDLKDRESFGENGPFIKGDVFDIPLEIYQKYSLKYSGIISDMAPNTTGNRSTDHLQSVSLCEKAVALSIDLVKTGGYLIVKIFQGGEFQSFIQMVKEYYNKVTIIKPKSSRKESREIFIVAEDKK